MANECICKHYQAPPVFDTAIDQINTWKALLSVPLPMLQHSIILFDGVCNLCNGAVQFIIKRDEKNYFRFTSLQSIPGQKLLEKYKLPLHTFNSFILIEEGKAYTKSAAALKVARKLNNPWPLLYAFMIIPKFVRDGIYKWIAGNRYKWFGKKDECILPTTQLKARFLNRS